MAMLNLVTFVPQTESWLRSPSTLAEGVQGRSTGEAESGRPGLVSSLARPEHGALDALPFSSLIRSPPAAVSQHSESCSEALPPDRARALCPFPCRRLMHARGVCSCAIDPAISWPWKAGLNLFLFFCHDGRVIQKPSGSSEVGRR